MALLMALTTTTGDLVYFTDSEGVYLNYHNGHRETPKGADADLWYRVREAVRERRADVIVMCIRSHMTEADICSGKISSSLAYGNTVADELAAGAA
eukprot:2493809-Pyramimonas_sp.AAC.1